MSRPAPPGERPIHPLAAPEDALPDLGAFDFDLPDALIARFPPPERDGGRLLDLRGEAPEDRLVTDLPGLFGEGDALVVNDVPVKPARMFARRATGGEVEVLLVGSLGGGRHRAMLRPARRLKVGEELLAGPGRVTVGEAIGDGLRVVTLDPHDLPEQIGEVPLPPYLERPAEATDRERYQTVYARESGLHAAAAPTAGLHFTPSMLAELERRGVRLVRVGLEVGPGTFLPLREEQLRTGRLHTERYVFPEEAWEAVARARRVIAVGTTAARVLEAAERPGEGETDLFIRPGYAFRKVDLLLTNFHLPRSSLLMLVCAFGGTERVMGAYRHAVAGGYRFYSYGDAMVVARRP